MARFELANAGVKVQCLTAWQHPNIKTALFIQLAATSTVCEDYERNFMTTSQMSYMIDYIKIFYVCQELFIIYFRFYTKVLKHYQTGTSY